MAQTKLTNILLLILIVLILFATISFFLWIQFGHSQQGTSAAVPESSALTAEELVKRTVETEDVTTDHLSGGYVQLQFQIQGSNPKVKEEIQKRMFQVRHIIIHTVCAMTADELRGAEGIVKLEGNIAEQINQLLHEGQVVKVYTTKKLLK